MVYQTLAIEAIVTLCTVLRLKDDTNSRLI